MSDINRELENNKEERPRHEEIQKLAHELYLARGGEHGQDVQDWHFAEEQLRWGHGERVGTKPTTFVVGPGGVTKTDSASDEEFIIAEQERRQVRATEELKEAGEGMTLPRTKAVSVGQQKTK